MDSILNVTCLRIGAYTCSMFMDFSLQCGKLMDSGSQCCTKYILWNIILTWIYWWGMLSSWSVRWTALLGGDRGRAYRCTSLQDFKGTVPDKQLYGVGIRAEHTDAPHCKFLKRECQMNSPTKYSCTKLQGGKCTVSVEQLIHVNLTVGYIKGLRSHEDRLVVWCTVSCARANWRFVRLQV